jgi:GxxExxY protein
MYAGALAIELDARGESYATERTVPVLYRGKLICHQRIDLLVGDQLIVEVKSADRFHSIHLAQILTYLRLTKLRAGLLANFNVAIMKDGLRRVVL